MIYTFLLTLLILDCVVLIGSILLQSGKGTGLAANFGGASSSADAFIGIRQAGNLLTKASWWCGGIFLFLAFVLQVSSTRARVPKSVLDRSFSTPASAVPAPTNVVPQTGAKAGLPLTPVNPAPAAPTTAPTPTAPTTTSPAPTTKP